MFLDDTIIIPQHISRHAFCSASFILFDSLLAFVLEYYALGTILFLLYFSTMLHWNCVQRMSVIKIIDIVLAVGSIYHATIIDSKRFTPYYQTVWFVTVIISFTMFFINEILFYFQVSSNNTVLRTSFLRSNYRTFHYFSREYTAPNSEARELAYYRNVYTHMLFLHVIIPWSCAICACRSLFLNYHNNLSA
jgi:hypothetical protein